MISKEVKALLKVGRNPNVVYNDLNIAINVTRTYADAEGLTHDEIASLANCMTVVSTKKSVFKDFILCLIPRATIDMEIVSKMIFWIFRHHQIKEGYCIKYVLYWIIIQIDYKLLNKEDLRPYYSIIFHLLEYSPQSVCHILFNITKPEDVLPERVLVLSEHIDRIGRKSYLITLMGLYKKLNPDLVVSKFDLYAISFSVETKFYIALKNAFARNSDRSIVQYVHRLDLQPMEKHKQSLAVLRSIKFSTTFLSNCDGSGSGDLKLDEKSVQALSMLHTDLGIVRLVQDVKLQRKLMDRLFRTLHEVFINTKTTATDREKEYILERLIAFQKFCLHGFQSISKFLSQYLKCWDGVAYKKHILKLIEWFTFNSEQELNRNLLHPMYTLFVSSEPEDMCNIINCLTSFVVNLYTVIEREKMGISGGMFDEERMLNSNDLIPALESVSKFVTFLCNFALVILPSNCKVLCAFMRFYERIHFMETTHNIVQLTVIPPIIVYQGLFSFNAQILNQICALLLKYDNWQRLADPDGVQDITKSLELFMTDIRNFLWTSNAFEERDSGYLFTDLSISDYNNWSDYVDLNKTFHVTNHMMFLPDQRLRVNKRNAKDNDDVLKTLEQIYPNIAELIQHVNCTM